MNAIGLLLAKDGRVLARSRLLATGLIVYPLLIALVVGLFVRYTGERPQVALVGEAALPSIVRVGDRSFDIRRLLEEAREVRLVAMSPERATTSRPSTVIATRPERTTQTSA